MGSFCSSPARLLRVVDFGVRIWGEAMTGRTRVVVLEVKMHPPASSVGLSARKFEKKLESEDNSTLIRAILVLFPKKTRRVAFNTALLLPTGAVLHQAALRRWRVHVWAPGRNVLAVTERHGKAPVKECCCTDAGKGSGSSVRLPSFDCRRNT